MLLTKADKLSRNQAQQALAVLRKQLDASTPVTAQIFSSSEGTGVEEARAAVMNLLLGEGRGDT